MRTNHRFIVVSILVVLLGLAWTPVAKAAEPGPLYVGIFGGYVIPRDFETPSGDVKMKNSSILGAKVGYIIPGFKWGAVELEYNHLFKQDVDQAGYSGDYASDNVMANFVLRYAPGFIHPYAGVGIGWSWAKFNGDVDTNSRDAFAWQILAGFTFDIDRNWSADLGYRYFESKYSVGGGDAKSKNNMILIGINYHF